MDFGPRLRGEEEEEEGRVGIGRAMGWGGGAEEDDRLMRGGGGGADGWSR